MKKNKFKNILLAFGNIFLCIMLAVLLLLTAYPAVVRLLGGSEHPTVFGFSTAVVVSGSMAEEIQVNDVVVIHKQKSYETGDIISFFNGGNLITHRIIGIKNNGFVTKGDANNTPDPDIAEYEQIAGKVVLVIPAVGAAIQFFSTPIGMTILFIAAVLLILLPTRKNHDADGGGVSEEK